jgi:hypothetical protein
VTLLLVPAALGFICGLLALASRLEEERVRSTIRMSLRSPRLTPELAEALVAAELAPLLVAHGMGRPA